MNSKFFVFFAFLLIISLVPISSAQVSIEEKSSQKSVLVSINSTGDVHITHVVNPSDLPKQTKLIAGTVSNLTVKDANGDEIDFSIFGVENDSVLIHPSKDDSIVEYDLEDALSQTDYGWTWDFRYLESIIFMLPEEVELIFANERLVYLDDKKGFKCHGCELVLEYSINEPRIFENVRLENKELLVEVQSYANIDNFNFDQSTKSITYDIDKENIRVTTVIPSKLLDEPYNVYLGDEEIIFHQFNKNATHVLLNMKATSPGEIRITGEAEIPENGVVGGTTEIPENGVVGGTTEIPENGIIIVGIVTILIILAFAVKRKFNRR